MMKVTMDNLKTIHTVDSTGWPGTPGVDYSSATGLLGQGNISFLTGRCRGSSDRAWVDGGEWSWRFWGSLVVCKHYPGIAAFILCYSTPTLVFTTARSARQKGRGQQTTIKLQFPQLKIWAVIVRLGSWRLPCLGSHRSEQVYSTGDQRLDFSINIHQYNWSNHSVCITSVCR